MSSDRFIFIIKQYLITIRYNTNASNLFGETFKSVE